MVLPLFTVGFVVFMKWSALLPADIRWYLGPYAQDRGLHLRLRPDWDFAGQVGGNAAVAFSEEFFYRGYMTMRFEQRWGPVRSALATAALFALGHLLTPAPWRLLVFFPALLFAWLRNRTHTIVGASVAHFLCNVWLRSSSGRTDQEAVAAAQKAEPRSRLRGNTQQRRRRKARLRRAAPRSLSQKVRSRIPAPSARSG